MDFHKIGFIGLGLIGGSLAKAIKKNYPDTEIIALASREETLLSAFEDKVISNSCFLSMEAFSDCDVIFLCSPVKINVSYLEKLKPYLNAHCILSDVGSVKGDINHTVEKLGLCHQFVGGHPMAGSEAFGYQNATPYLLENAYYILTVTEAFPEERLQIFSQFLNSLGCLTLIMSPQKHDFSTACISHLPHIIAASLVNFVCQEDDAQETLKTIAAGGFRDITRIASSSPVMWQHICETNSQEILKVYDLYLESLSRFKNAILSKNENELISLFSSAKDYRDNLPVKNTGAIPAVFEIYLDLADETGGIATIASLLAKNNISIKNIGIVHNREFEQGVLRIEFYTQQAMHDSITILETDYIVHK